MSTGLSWITEKLFKGLASKSSIENYLNWDLVTDTDVTTITSKLLLAKDEYSYDDFYAIISQFSNSKKFNVDESDFIETCAKTFSYKLLLNLITSSKKIFLLFSKKKKIIINIIKNQLEENSLDEENLVTIKKIISNDIFDSHSKNIYPLALSLKNDIFNK